MVDEDGAAEQGHLPFHGKEGGDRAQACLLVLTPLLTTCNQAGINPESRCCPEP